jgi:hypothetical protein
MTDDLVQFVRDRLDDEARIAGAATPGPWEWTPPEDVWGHCGPALIRAGYDGEGDRELVEVLSGWGHDAWGMNVTAENQAHIARHDPARVLADIEVKRSILDEHHQDGTGCAVCADPEEYDENSEGEAEWIRSAKWWPCRTVRLLALPYADHPDYRKEWRP